MQEGIVIKSTGSWYEVRDIDGTVSLCRLRGKIRLDGLRTTNPIAVGDKVFYEREVNKVKIIESRRSIFPIASGELDDFIGVVQAKDILSAMFTDKKFDVHKIVKEPLVVSEHLETLELLKEFVLICFLHYNYL